MESTISHAYTETMIELRLWQILAVFAQEGTLSASAKRLHISQPALSQALVRLEKELGVSLCERSSHNRISLNERGKEAAKKAQALLDQATALETELRAASALNIGICAPVPADLLREPLEQTFHQQARFVMEESPDSLLLRLQSGQYRLIVSCRPETETALYCRKWEEESLSLAIPKNHPLASREIIRDEDLVGQSLLLYRRIGWWNQIVKDRLSRTDFLSIDSETTFSNAASLGAFPFFISDHLINDISIAKPEQFVFRPAENMKVEYYLICPAADQSMVRLIQELYR